MAEKSGNLLAKDDVWDDSELIKMYDDSVKGNFDKKKKDKQQNWKNGDMCMAPFEDGLWYSAKIISIQSENKTAKVKFLEYEEEEPATVVLGDLYREDEVQYEEDTEMSSTPQPPHSNDEFSMPLPTMIPPPPQLFKPITNEKEITNNLMVSWYMSGYHTGYYQAMVDFKKKAAESASQKH